MERREYGAMLATVGTVLLSGCGAIGAVLRGDEDKEKIERIKAEAESPSWNELMQHTDDWKGKPVHYSGVEISAVDEANNGSFQMIVNYSASGDKVLYCTWYGDRVDIEGTFDIWGVVNGTHTFSFGEKETVPNIKLVDIKSSE